MESVLVLSRCLRKSDVQKYFFRRRYYSNERTLNAGKELTLHERARALVESRKSGTLTTVSLESNQKHPPLFGSIMPYVLIDDFKGCPVFGLRVGEQHYDHVLSFTKSSFVIFPLTPLEIPPSEVPIFRVNFTGDVTLIPEEKQEETKKKFIGRHPAATDIITSNPYTFFKFVPSSVYFLGGTQFGKTDMVSAQKYLDSKVDSVAPYSNEIINLMNTKYRNDLHLFVEKYSDQVPLEGSVFMYFVDRFGFNMLCKVKTVEDFKNHSPTAGYIWSEMRFPFPFEMEGSDCLQTKENSLLE